MRLQLRFYQLLSGKIANIHPGKRHVIGVWVGERSGAVNPVEWLLPC